jgi:hypothetical protein
MRPYLILSILPSLVLADESAIDKVYHPYVQPLEREVEWRMISADSEQLHRFGIGKSFSDRLFIEGYLIAEDNKEGNFSLTAYELEAKYQLTEQGEYAVDWGVIMEIEKEKDEDSWEVAGGVLMEKEWGRWVGAVNFWGIYEWGDNKDDEIESVLALQARYRYSRFLEPAIEFYSGEETRGLGPVLMGDVRMGTGKKLHWEAGAIIGLDSKTPDNTWRLLTEFEF